MTTLRANSRVDAMGRLADDLVALQTRQHSRQAIPGELLVIHNQNGAPGACITDNLSRWRFLAHLHMLDDRKRQLEPERAPRA